MARSGLLPVVVLVLLVSAARPAGAQAPATSGPVPVSPGAVGRAMLADACPSFSWAPREWAPGHELAVFELVDGALTSEPKIRTRLPARASAWTPSQDECLDEGATYLWFIREVTPVGEVVSEWSSGNAFTVVESGRQLSVSSQGAATGDDQTSTGRPARDAVINEQPPDKPPDSIQEKLLEINSKLDELLEPVSRQLCFEIGLELEAHKEFEAEVKAEAEGRAGAEGYGNGLMAKVRALPGKLGLKAAIKGAAVPKYAICLSVDPVFGFSGAASGQTQLASAVAGPDALTDSDITDRLLALVSKLDLTDARMAAAMEGLPDFQADGDLWDAIREGGILQKAADILPLPDGLRSNFENPGQIIESFRSQLALCQQSNLPPAVADLVGEFCGLVANEPFRKLLNRVDTAVSTVKTTVDNILSQLPVQGDCKLFCGDSFRD